MRESESEKEERSEAKVRGSMVRDGVCESFRKEDTRANRNLD